MTFDQFMTQISPYILGAIIAIVLIVYFVKYASIATFVCEVGEYLDNLPLKECPTQLMRDYHNFIIDEKNLGTLPEDVAEKIRKKSDQRTWVRSTDK